MVNERLSFEENCPQKIRRCAAGDRKPADDLAAQEASEVRSVASAAAKIARKIDGEQPP
ncbi:hypothetical protein ACFIOY_25735 [Bradyrhizobium sp. TZ2]